MCIVFSPLKQRRRHGNYLALRRTRAYYGRNVSPLLEVYCAFGVDGGFRLRRRPGECVRLASRLRTPAGRRAHDGALVVVRSVGDQARTGTRDALHEGGRHRRVRSPTHLRAGVGRSRQGHQEFSVHERGVSGCAHLHRRKGQGTGTAHGSDAGERVAVRWTAHSGGTGVAATARADWLPQSPRGREADRRLRRRWQAVAGRQSGARQRDVLHFEPDAADGKATGGRRRRLGVESL